MKRIFFFLSLCLFLGTASAKDKGEVDAMLDTMKILKEKDAKVLITINKDLSMDVIGIHKGEKIKPCKLNKNDESLTDEEKRLKCYPVGHNPYGNILKEANIQIREGSVCISIWVGSRRYDFCDPPYDLNF